VFNNQRHPVRHQETETKKLSGSTRPTLKMAGSLPQRKQTGHRIIKKAVSRLSEILMNKI